MEGINVETITATNTENGFVEFEGKTVEKAIEDACNYFGLSQDDLNIEILTRGSTGLFGLGGRKAKIKAKPREGVTPNISPNKTSLEEHSYESSNDSSNTEESTYNTENSDTSSSVDEEIEQEDNDDLEAEGIPTAKEVTEEQAEMARQIITDLMQKAGFEPEINLKHYPDRIAIELTGADMSLIIGKEGQTLDAIEYMVRRILVRRAGCVIRLTVDAAGYRTKREQSLSQLAKRNAAKAKRIGRAVVMNPMGPRDRRTVHLALRNFPGVRTKSIGDGELKKIVITPIRRQQHYHRRNTRTHHHRRRY